MIEITEEFNTLLISGSNDDQQKGISTHFTSFMLFIYLFIIVILTIRNLVEILRVLKDGNFQTIKWLDLGLYLGLNYNDLKTIEDNYPRDAERRLRECLAKWLTNDTEATLDKLAIAAGEVGETSVAEYISEIIINYKLEQVILLYANNFILLCTLY